jgi:hypothetical protein
MFSSLGTKKAGDEETRAGDRLMIGSRIRLAILVALAIAILLGGLLVHGYNTAPAGYAAVYTVMGMWVLAVLLALVGPLLLIFRRTRFAGMALAATAVLVPVTFFCGVKASQIAGLTHWLNEPMQRFGPDVLASFVVYYRVGTSERQISQFQDSFLYRNRSDGRGQDFRPGVRMYLRLLPSQAHGHEGFALNLDPSVGQEERDSLESSFSNSPVVFKVYKDIAPSKIPDPEKPN